MQKERKTLEKALLAAGLILKRHIKLPKKVLLKSPIDIVTETDKKAERTIIEIIGRAFPKHSILAEESGVQQGEESSKWIIDPLDGTTNFTHSFPEACVSIAYEYRGAIKLAGVFNPFHDELFWAEKGKGAYLNDKRIHVSKTKRLTESLVATGFPYDRRRFARYYINMMETVMQTCRGIRRLGSAALDLCYLACGRYDAYWEFKLNPWDQAAGILIVREAGGHCTNFMGKPLSVYEKQTLATNSHVHREMLKVLQESILTGV